MSANKNGLERLEKVMHYLEKLMGVEKQRAKLGGSTSESYDSFAEEFPGKDESEQSQVLRNEVYWER